MMVPSRQHQAEVLVQAVQNHNPDVIIVDEIGTKAVSGCSWDQQTSWVVSPSVVECIVRVCWQQQYA
jgi:hypothetical protein